MRWRIHRAHVALVHDIVMAGVAFVAAVWLRVGDDGWDEAAPAVMLGAPLFMAIAAAVFSMTGLYRGVWRYASLDDFLAIARAGALTALLALAVMFLTTRGDSLPRSSLVIAWFALVVLLAGPRMVYRVLKDGHVTHLFRRTLPQSGVPVLLVGAGDEAEQFIRAMVKHREAPYRPVGIVDEKTARVGLSIRGVPILGTVDDLAATLDRLRARDQAPQRLIVTRDQLDAQRLRGILDQADRLALPIARLPRLSDLQATGDEAVELRPIAIEDLLGRPQLPLDRDAMARLIAGRRVLVTGAGGSIGSELTQQIAALGPSRLALLDASEFALYQIDLDLGERHPALERAAILGDVRDRGGMRRLFLAERPDLVFHAAALKHVPMVEANGDEGILTNVVGTRVVADLAREMGVTAMVAISTDKAVNPANIMGATKRLAEAYCQALDVDAARRRAAGQPATRFVTVRFGNVLGSTGSVVPLFQRQLARGGPLTVTHPEMTRYFMTVREAVELVLQASAHADDAGATAGRIHVLEMGEPVRIIDLARQMIRLAGLRPEIDVAIAITGMRPGERLHEELFHAAEELVETAVPGVRLAAPRTGDAAVLARALDELEATARARRAEDAVAQLMRLVPEFRPSQIPVSRAVGEGRSAAPSRP
jgi:O-antigen biosynthesis protein WbqV